MIQILKADSVAAAREISGRLIPFRAPHHTCSSVGLIDELRLATGGVLYLDDAAEFRRQQIGDLCARIAHGGPLPLAVVVDVRNPFKGTKDAAHAPKYQERIDAVVAQLEEAASEVQA